MAVNKGGEAATYQNLSVQVQEKTFDKLISMCNIQKGWKILDFGCGTGNGAATLVDVVGPKGMVIGTDPIKERLEQATQTFRRVNLDFHVAFGTDSPKYGDDFDLVTSCYVMNWIPYNEKLLTLQQVSKCLRPGRSFAFATSTGEKLNWMSFISLLPEDLQRQASAAHHFETGESYKKMALDNGFDDVLVKEVPVMMPFKSLDDAMKLLAASLNTNDYENTLKCVTEISKKNDISFLYNDKGEVVVSDVVIFVICKKQ